MTFHRSSKSSYANGRRDELTAFGFPEFIPGQRERFCDGALIQSVNGKDECIPVALRSNYLGDVAELIEQGDVRTQLCEGQRDSWPDF